MKSHGLVRRAIRGTLATMVLGPLLACGTPQHKQAATPAEMPMPEATRAPLAHAPDVDDDVPAAPRAHVDTRACEPAGKSVVVVARDAEGRPERWRYFETRHGRRALTCEAADSNGDGKVDARYFYNRSGRLVLEQRDLDFDGHAEVVADYSQFKFAAHTARPRAHDGN
ncbi:MAG TPA: hypothetical protein VK989_07555 [Polyangia bacterium]|jgi:hypothetical protein|nr:hypothetical protein [Polyangia bacterium]